MESLLYPEFWLAVGQIIMIDILLGGDNAVVIALACRRLPPQQRRQGILWGTAGAIILRVALIFFALALLSIPYLKLIGAILLLWIGTLFSRRLHAEATEQAHLREIISAANRDLEEKVRLRTLELEAANRKLEDLSSTDALTGLANRRRFDAVWELEWQRALRQGFALAVAMIDVDHFKDYNDHYGHQAGDDCLRRLAQVLAAASQRSGELAARYGGEEFVIVLPGVNAEDAMANAERIRSAVQALNIVNAVDIPAGMLTVSIGVACRVPTAHDSPASLLRAADAALYEAKHQGRNRVCFAA